MFLLWFAILFLVRGEFKTSWEIIKTNRVFHIMGLFITFMFLSLFWSGDTHEAHSQLRLYKYWIILIPILAVTLKREWLSNIITAFLLGMFISEIVAYGIFFEWWTYKNSTPDYPSPFMFHIHYSVFLAVTSITLLSRLLSDRYTWQSKLPMFLFFLTSTGNLMISTGRTGQLALLVAMAVAIILHYRLTLKSLLIFVTLSITLFFGAYSSISLFQKRIDIGVSDVRQFQQGNFETSWGLRAAFWVITYDILKEHPLIGAGVGGYKKAAVEVLAQNDHGFTPGTIQWCSTYHYHNQYLMVLAQGGLIAFTLMLWMLFELFRLKIEDRELREFSILGLTVFIVGSIAEPLWILKFPMILFVFIISLSLASARHSIKQ
jgi:O-antigen ligase